MSTVYHTRTVRFSAGHQYYRPEWSESRNHEVFGACARAPGHGHNYILEVMVAGEPHPDTGFSVNLAELDEVLRVEVHERLDHGPITTAPALRPSHRVTSLCEPRRGAQAPAATSVMFFDSQSICWLTSPG